MKRTITSLIGLLLILFYCASCAIFPQSEEERNARKANRQLRKAERHIRKAELFGAKWHRDTLWKDLKFSVPGINVKFTPKILTYGKPMMFVKDSVRTEVLIIPGEPGKRDSIFVNTDCPPQEVTAKVPIGTDNEIKAQNTSGHFWRGLLWGFIAGVVACYLFLRKGPGSRLEISFNEAKKPPK
jgi:hypothetical protein